MAINTITIDLGVKKGLYNNDVTNDQARCYHLILCERKNGDIRKLKGFAKR